MDLDLLYALLTIGAASPYVAGAAVDWVQRGKHGKALSSFVHSRLSQGMR